MAGCGSLGGALAGFLSRTSQVVCYDRDPLLVRRLNKEGLALKVNGRERRVRIWSVDDVKALQGMRFDLLIVATKCADVKGAVETLMPAARTRTVLFLQNGFLSPAQARAIPGDIDILRGVTTMAVRSVRRGQLEVSSIGNVYCGCFRGHWQVLGATLRLLAGAGLGACRVSDYRGAEWAKAIFNAVMNPLPIIFGRGYDIVRTDPKAYEVVCEAIAEGKQAARMSGVRLAFDPMRIVRGLRAGTFGRMEHRGSMYYDFMAGRPLELEAITGEVIRSARRRGVRVPALEAIYQGVLSLEAQRDAV